MNHVQSTPPQGDDRPEILHEQADIYVRPVLWVAFSLVVVVIASMAFLAWLLATFNTAAEESDEASAAIAARPSEPPAPRLQSSPQEEMGALHARQAEKLATSAWIDRQAGIARVPIDRAIDSVAQQGLPTWPAASPSESSPSPPPVPSTSPSPTSPSPTPPAAPEAPE